LFIPSHLAYGAGAGDVIPLILILFWNRIVRS
jgi:hypothetical protein